MEVLVTFIDDDTKRPEGALDLLALALARAFTSPSVATGADVSVYADVDRPTTGVWR